MKTLCFLPLLLLVTFNNINAQQKTFVPDDVFEQYLINKTWDDVLDDSVLTASISGQPLVDVRNIGINDLTGIEDFVGLQILHCEDNNIPYISISGATGLRDLYCSNNQLTSLDVSQNPALKLLVCYGNQIGSLDVSQNIVLTSLSCSSNSIKMLNVSGAIALTGLSCERNKLFSLDLTQNIALKTLNCQYNQLMIVNIANGHNDLITSFNALFNQFLTCIGVDDPVKANNDESPYTNWVKPATATYSDGCTLPRTYVPDDQFERVLGELGYDDIPGDDSVTTAYISIIETLDIAVEGIIDLTGIKDFTSLIDLDCSNNQVVELDLSQNKLLEKLNCSNNNLTGLNVRNGTNYLLTAFNATGNPLLGCITVDDEIKANEGFPPYNLWLEDATAGYSANCSFFGVKTYVPDDHFEQALINLGLDFGVLDDSVSASVISRITTLNVASKYIQDLTGIEGFINLEVLNCYNNFLQNLDLTQNSSLEYLSCYTNQLADLDLSGNPSLNSLNCTNNEFTSLDMTDCPELVYLNCQNNQISQLILTGNPKLETLLCRTNLIESLNLTNNSLLRSLDCWNNRLTSLDVSNKTDLIILDCGSNLLTDLPLDGVNLVDLSCDYNMIQSLDLSGCTSMNELDCNDNQLTSLTLGAKSSMWFLDCSRNQLQSLDLQEASGLVDFVCTNNQLQSLDVSNSPLLGGLYCANNQIESLELENNPDLLTLVCHHNEITYLDLSANLKLRTIWVSDNPLVGFIEPGGTGKKGGETLNTNISGLKASLAINDLTDLNISNTDLSSINVLNFVYLNSLYVQGTQLNSLDVSGNLVLKYLNATSTPLGCIQVNQNQLNSIPPGWVKDAATIYSVDCQAVSIREDRVPDESIRVYPNPAGDLLTVDSDIPIINVEIYSLTGKRVMLVYSQFSEIPVSGLADGTYIMKAETINGVTSRKFTVKH
ncbi:MAG: T9SS type A sorting domain-containing protein [Bacteroidia bacterium]|nr:MAG: T9SS type A sorting domain-containing protein [Bacteroidia bacterium]